MCYIYLRLLFGIACLAYYTAIKFALYQLLYPEFIVNSFDIKRAAATFVQFVAHSMANINNIMPGPSGHRTPTGGVISGRANHYTTAPLYYTTAPLYYTTAPLLLSPILFNIFLEDIMTHAQDNYNGTISIRDGKITNLRFAVDIDDVTGEEDELTKRVHNLDTAAA